MNYAHEYKIVAKPPPGSASSYKNGLGKEAPLRIVAHTFKGISAPKRNPDVNPRGISRNVLGGFYTR